MIRAIVTGAGGRMGGQLIRMVRDTDGLKLVGATERPGNAKIGLDAGLAAGLGRLEVPVLDGLEPALDVSRAEVVIDFTSAEASLHHAEICAARGVAMVVGSTGFGSDAKARIARAAEKIPIVMSPNMSLSVAVMFELVRRAAHTLREGYDVEVLELHHRMKKDAPSGTALRLAELAAAERGHEPAQALRLAREGTIGERPDREIGVQALRGGDVVGEHTVYFIGEGERLEIAHRSTSRDQYARGAVRAAQWVVGKSPGLYDMNDVLGFGAKR